MKFKSEEIRVLQDLGLTFRQAKVYFALVISGTSSASAISKVSKVARQDTYRILSELQELGLAEKIVSSPHNQFRVTPVTASLATLVQHKKKKVAKLEKKITSIFSDFRKEKEETMPAKEEGEFILVSEKEATRRRAVEALENAQASNDCIISRQALEYALYRDRELFKKTLERGVKFRHIIYKNENDKKILQIASVFKNHPNFLIKYVIGPFSGQIVIIDNKITFVSTGPEGGLNAPTLWSTNPTFIATMHNHFKTLWKTAKEITNSRNVSHRLNRI